MAEHAAIYLGSSRHSNGGRHGRICFDESAVVENHVSDGGAASVRAILPTGIGEDGEIGIWDAMVKAYVVDGIGDSTIWIKFKSIVGAATKLTNEQVRASKSTIPGEMHAFASLLTAKRISTHVLEAR